MVFDGQRLKAVRKKIGLTQEEMADVLGLKQGSYSDIERGKTKEISGGTKKILENEYGVNIDYLYRKSESMSIDDAKFFAEQSTQSVVNEYTFTFKIEEFTKNEPHNEAFD